MRYYMLNKPYGSVSARSDSKYPTVMDCFPLEDRKVLFPVGRLDVDTTGLMIVTDDGWLCHCLTYPGFKVVKEYFFMAFGTISPEHREKIHQGITLPGNGLRAAPAELHIHRVSTVLDCAEHLPAHIREAALRNPTGSVTIGSICVTEGRKHEVKLLIKSAGCHVFMLRRERLGGLHLDPNLPQGNYRELTEAEVQVLLDADK